MIVAEKGQPITYSPTLTFDMEIWVALGDVVDSVERTVPLIESHIFPDRYRAEYPLGVGLRHGSEIFVSQRDRVSSHLGFAFDRNNNHLLMKEIL